MTKIITNNTLILPDAHAHPYHDNLRFRALGNYIVDTKPDTIVCIGDFADMASLSSYDKGRRSFEGRRYTSDVKASLDAMQELLGPMQRANKKANKQRRYSPRMIMCVGNHEDRINRASNDHPELHGTISVDDLKFKEFGWEVYPFNTNVVVDGVAFSHYFPSGVQGRAISGENIAAKMVKTNHCSSVQGHSHVYSHYEHTKPNGQKLFGLSCGCYTHPDMIEGWNQNTHHLWWRGVVVLEGTKHWPGYYEGIHAITQAKIMKDYL